MPQLLDTETIVALLKSTQEVTEAQTCVSWRP